MRVFFFLAYKHTRTPLNICFILFICIKNLCKSFAGIKMYSVNDKHFLYDFSFTSYA